MLALLALIACGSPDDSDTDVAALPEPRALAELSSGQCPDLTTTGTKTFTSNGKEREVRVYFPDGNADNLPVVFAWHWLGGSAAQMTSALDLDGYASDHDVIIVVPQALSSNPFEWNFVSGESEAADDLALFDDLRTCLSRDRHADMHRVYTTGMSAGGLWSTFLTIHRGDTFAATMIMSGGTDPIVQYSPPAGENVPVLLMWGGDADVLSGGGFDLDFQAMTLAFSSELRADDHFVVHCNHGMGHTIPPDGMDVAEGWLFPHVYGVASPLIGTDPTLLADYCGLPE
jgi:poly(3-hydroxybutyrate) depolymerase